MRKLADPKRFVLKNCEIRVGRGQVTHFYPMLDSGMERRIFWLRGFNRVQIRDQPTPKRKCI